MPGSVARCLRPAVPAVLALVLTACAMPVEGQEVVLTSGVLGATTWILARHVVDDATCLEVRFAHGTTAGLCASPGGTFGVNVVDDPAGNGSILVAEVPEEGLVAGDVVFDLRPGAPVTLVEASGLGTFAVAAIEGHQRPLRVVLRDATRTRIVTMDVP